MNLSGISPLLAFALTATIIEVTPGPNMAYIATLSLSHGLRVGFAAVAGIALGLMTYGIAAALGLAALIDSSRLLYEMLRWAGVAYLVWLAWDAWSSESETSPDTVDGENSQPWRAFRRGLVTNLLNPKAAIFYVAVLPEFVRIDGGSVVTQTLMLSVIYVGIATAIHAGIVLLAGSLQGTIATPDRRRTVRRGLALVLFGIAIWFALTSDRPH
ncbi:MAG: Lysine exporter protein [Tardiphaga sp.]|nr:Lysine exporter protein [Tardiphaga sp.]